jgi:hypothetical protein
MCATGLHDGKIGMLQCSQKHGTYLTGTAYGSEVMAMTNYQRAVEGYRQKIDECLAMAKTATSNKIRAYHYAMAERYLELEKRESKRASRSASRLRSRLALLLPRIGTAGLH